MQWEVNVQGKAAGPVSSTRLKQLADAGRVVPGDYVRAVGDREWKRAAEIDGLFGRIVRTPQAPPAIPIAVPIVMPPPAPQAAASAPAKNQTTFAVRPQRIALVITSLIGAAGTFLPWAHIGALSINGTQGDGWITFVFFALVIVASLSGRLQQPLGWIATVFAVLGGAAAFCVAIEKINAFERMTAKAREDLAGNAFGLLITQTTTVGNGLHLIAIAGVTSVGIALFFRRRSD